MARKKHPKKHRKDHHDAQGPEKENQYAKELTHGAVHAARGLKQAANAINKVGIDEPVVSMEKFETNIVAAITENSANAAIEKLTGETPEELTAHIAATLSGRTLEGEAKREAEFGHTHLDKKAIHKAQVTAQVTAKVAEKGLQAATPQITAALFPYLGPLAAIAGPLIAKVAVPLVAGVVEGALEYRQLHQQEVRESQRTTAAGRFILHQREEQLKRANPKMPAKERLALEKENKALLEKHVEKHGKNLPKRPR